MDLDSDVIECGVDVLDASKKTYMNTYHPYLYDSEQVIDMITIPFKLEKNIYKPLIKPIREIVKTVSYFRFILTAVSARIILNQWLMFSVRFGTFDSMIGYEKSKLREDVEKTYRKFNSTYFRQVKLTLTGCIKEIDPIIKESCEYILGKAIWKDDTEIAIKDDLKISLNIKGLSCIFESVLDELTKNTDMHIFEHAENRILKLLVSDFQLEIKDHDLKRYVVESLVRNCIWSKPTSTVDTFFGDKYTEYMKDSIKTKKEVADWVLKWQKLLSIYCPNSMTNTDGFQKSIKKSHEAVVLLLFGNDYIKKHKLSIKCSSVLPMNKGGVSFVKFQIGDIETVLNKSIELLDDDMIDTKTILEKRFDKLSIDSKEFTRNIKISINRHKGSLCVIPINELIQSVEATEDIVFDMDFSAERSRTHCVCSAKGTEAPVGKATCKLEQKFKSVDSHHSDTALEKLKRTIKYTCDWILSTDGTCFILDFKSVDDDGEFFMEEITLDLPISIFASIHQYIINEKRKTEAECDYVSYWESRSQMYECLVDAEASDKDCPFLFHKRVKKEVQEWFPAMSFMTDGYSIRCIFQRFRVFNLNPIVHLDSIVRRNLDRIKGVQVSIDTFPRGIYKSEDVSLSGKEPTYKEHTFRQFKPESHKLMKIERIVIKPTDVAKIKTVSIHGMDPGIVNLLSSVNISMSIDRFKSLDLEEFISLLKNEADDNFSTVYKSGTTVKQSDYRSYTLQNMYENKEKNIRKKYIIDKVFTDWGKTSADGLESTCKTSNLQEFDKYISHYKVYEKQLWNYWLDEFHLQWDFRLFRAKQKASAAVCRQVLGHGDKNMINKDKKSFDYKTICKKKRGAFKSDEYRIIFMGRADVGSGKFGYASCPSKQWLSRLAKCPNTIVILVDEFNTSKCCSYCGNVLENPSEFEFDKSCTEKVKEEDRAAKYRKFCNRNRVCKNSLCYFGKDSTLVDRDINASINMMNKGLSVIFDTNIVPYLSRPTEEIGAKRERKKDKDNPKVKRRKTDKVSVTSTTTEDESLSVDVDFKLSKRISAGDVAIRDW